VTDLQAELLRIDEVLVDVALWIDNDTGVTLLVAEEIGGMSEAAEIVLFQDHGGLSLALRVEGGQQRDGRGNFLPGEEWPTTHPRTRNRWIFSTETTQRVTWPVLVR
jgi:hypothetical protein